MTREEIIQAISDDKLMPFIQPDHLAQIVDFVIKNYHPSLPSNLGEAAEEYAYQGIPDIMKPAFKPLADEVVKYFKAGAEWMASREEQEQPMPDSTQLIEFWNEDKEMLKEKDFRDDAWRLAYNAFMCGFVRGVSVKKQEQPLTKEKVVEQCKRFGGNPEVIQQEQKCIFGNTPSEDICSVCSAYCSLRVPKTKVSTSTEITATSGQVEKLTFEEYLRGVFEINNGIENDPDNLVRIHAPELLKLARKHEQPEVDLEKEIDSYWNKVTGFQPPFAVLELKKKDLAEVARHFAEWQKERDHNACQSCEKNRDVVFYKGMKYAKKQMMEEAVEGKVEISYSDDTALINCPYKGNTDDRVKLILFKD